VHRGARPALDLPTGSAKAVHRARRSLKRTRALLRLGESIGGTDTRVVRQRLARHARQLSAARDAAVIGKLAAHLREKCHGAEARAVLTKMIRTSGGEAPPLPRTEWQARLRATLAELESTEWRSLRRQRLRRALRRELRRAQKRYGEIGDGDDATRIHAWRKAVVRLRDQIEMVCAWLTRRERKVVRRLAGIARRLGVAMDCTVFLGALRRTRGVPAAARRRLVHLVEKRRKKALRNAVNRWPRVRREAKKRLR